MKENKSYFILFASCMPVKGYSRSVICDLQRYDFEFIPNALYELITTYKNYTLEEILEMFNDDDKTIHSYYDYLIKNEFGFWGDKNDFDKFPSLDIVWESSSLITNLIIDVSEKSNHDYHKVANDINIIGCKALEIRFFYKTDPSRLRNILMHFKDSRLLSISLVIVNNKDFSLSTIEDICDSFPLIKNITISSSSSTKRKITTKSVVIDYIDRVVDSNSCCGVISPKNFRVNIEFFTESYNYNSCLNKKLGIDEYGNVKNCPSSSDIIGNLSQNSIIDLLSVDSKEEKILDKYKAITKDKIEVCKDCEFRYICTDCRVFTKDNSDIYSKPAKCSYNPYKMLWND